MARRGKRRTDCRSWRRPTVAPPSRQISPEAAAEPEQPRHLRVGEGQGGIDLRTRPR
ncbi:hypothetical protein [Streptomyces sp. NPDC002156]